MPTWIATINPRVATAVALFARGGYGTLVLDKKITLDTDVLLDGRKPLVPLTFIDQPQNTVLRFPLAPDATLSIAQRGTALDILAAQGGEAPSVVHELVAQPDFALGARLIAPVSDIAHPVRFRDPVVGDELIIIPLVGSEPFAAKRRLADLTVWPAARGLVLEPRRPDLTVQTATDGLEISAPGGLNLSPSSDTHTPIPPPTSPPPRNNAPTALLASASTPSVFNLAAWHGLPGETFVHARQRLTQAFLDAPETDRNQVRLDLARFYLARGFGVESLAVLTVLGGDVPALALHPEFLVLRGAASILAGRNTDGLNDLDKSGLADQLEPLLWEAFAAAQARDWTTAETKFKRAASLLPIYPDPLYSRFVLLAAESALAMGSDSEATDLLAALEERNPALHQDPRLLYLRGELYSKAGHFEEAEKLWRTVVRDRDRLYKIRAELALTDLHVATHHLLPTRAAKRLEGLRFAWRGDSLEMDILNRLGTFHLDAGEYQAGLEAWAEITRLYPQSPLAASIMAQMSHTLTAVFLENAAPTLSTINALALYNRFRDLIPVPDREAVVRQLVGWLTTLDLIDQAVTILENHLPHTLTPQAKVEDSTRLTALRLLNGDGEAALAALALAPASNEPLPSDLLDERRLLQARALGILHRYDEAFTALEGLQSHPANLLKAETLLRAQKWTEAALTLGALVGEPLAEDQATGPSPERQTLILDRVIALALAGDENSLRDLSAAFGPLMDKTPQGAIFHLLTRPDKPGPAPDLSTVRARIAEVDLFQTFLDAYRRGGPQPATPPAPPAPASAPPPPSPAASPPPD